MRNIIYCCVLFLLLSCKDKKEPLIDSLCPCDFERGRREYADLDQREIVLFYDSIPGETWYEWVYQRPGDQGYIIYDTKRDSAVCYTDDGFYHSLICNFPEEAKNWDVGIDGVAVICSATAYRSCFLPTTFEFAYFDVILTLFQKKQP